MLNVFYTEILKLRRTKIFWLVVIGALLPALISAFAAWGNMSWTDLYKNNLLFLNVMVSPLLLSLLSGYVVAREYGDSTINQLFVYPYRRMSILLGKTFVVALLSLAVIALNYFAIWMIGSLMSDQPISNDLIGRYTDAFLWMAALQVLLAPLMMATGIVGKSYIPSVVLGIIAILVNMMAISGVEDHLAGRVLFVSYLPFGTMIIQLLDITKPGVEDHIHALIPHAVMFLLLFVFNAFYYTKSEVHSGS